MAAASHCTALFASMQQPSLNAHPTAAPASTPNSFQLLTSKGCCACADAPTPSLPAAALQQLKRKKMFEQQQVQVQNNMDRIEEQRGQLEQQASMATTVAALRTGAQANKATMQVGQGG